MKFSGAGNINQEAPPPSTQASTRRRGLLQASDPDGSWASVGIGLLKMSICLAIALGAYLYLPSFEGWSFGDDFPNGKIGVLTCIALPCAIFGAGSNLWASLRSAAMASRS